MSITSRINEIETHLKEDYTNLEALGYDIPQDKNIENIASVLDNVWESQSHIEETGTTLSMNTNKGKAKVDLLGNTYQESTTGKNLLAYTLASIKSINSATGSSWNDNVYTWNGVTFTINDDLSVKVNGTASAATYLILNNNLSLTSGTEYILNGCPSGGNASTYALRIYTGSSYESEIGNGKTFTYGSQNLVRINVFGGTTVNNLTFYPMIRLSSVTDDAYEPYTNGASPNPTYPQDIHIVSGDNKIIVANENLFNIEDLLAKANNVVKNSDGSYTFNSATAMYNTTTPLNYSPNEQLTTSYKLTNGTGTNFRLRWVYEDGYISDLSGSSSGTSEVSISNTSATLSTHGKVVGFRANWTNAGTFTIKEFMVNEGTSAIDYVPYQGTNYSINLGVNQLWNLGNVETNGTFSSNSSILLGSINFEVGTYTISLEKELLNSSYLYIGPSGSVVDSITKEKTFTIETAGNYDIRYIRKAGTYDNFKTKVDLTIGDHIQYISDNPIELNKIGDYQDKFIRNSGKNILPTTLYNLALNASGESRGLIVGNPNRNAYYCEIEPNTIYYISRSSVGTATYWYYAYTDVEPKDGVMSLSYANMGTDLQTQITTPSNAKYLCVFMGGGLSNDVMVSKENTPYEPYGNGDWYLKKEIGKVVLDGEEVNWTEYTNTASGLYKAYTTSVKVGRTNDYEVDGYSNYFDVLNAFSQGSTYVNMALTKNATYLSLPSSIASSIESLRTWLGTHNTEIRYILATPTYTKIEGTLASQLEDVWRANTYDNQTNVSQVNNDLPFELYFKALGTPSNVSLLSMNRPSLQLNNPIENIEEIEESGDLDGENQENI